MWNAHDRKLQESGLIKNPSELENGTNIFPNRKKGFNGRKFTIGTIEYSDFMQKEGRHYTGIGMCLLKQLASSLNFTYEFRQPRDGAFGSKSRDGNWTGMVGQVQRKEVDFIFATLSMTPERDDVLDYSAPFQHTFYRFVYKNPANSNASWNIYLLPFEWEVVVLMAISLVITITFVLITNAICSTSLRTSDEGRSKTSGVLDVVFTFYGKLFQQASIPLTLPPPSNILLSSWSLLCVIMAAMYGGKLVAFLTVTRQSVPFETLEDLINQDTYTWGFLGESFLLSAVPSSKSATVRKIWAGMKRFNQTDPTVLSTDLAVHKSRVLDGDYAFVGSELVLSQWTGDHSDLMVLKEPLLPDKNALGFPNNSAFTPLFSDVLMRITETGLYNWQIKLTHTLPLGGVNRSSQSQTVVLKTAQGAFYVLFIGTGIAIVLLLAEILVSKYNRCVN